MATTAKKQKEDMALGLGKYYEAEREDLWGRVDREAAVNGMSSLIDPSTLVPTSSTSAPKKSQSSGATGGSSNTSASGGSISTGGYTVGGSGSNYSFGVADSDTESYSGGLGLNSLLASVLGTAGGIGLGMQGMPMAGTFGSIFSGILGDGMSQDKMQQTLVNGGLGTLASAVNPIAGILYSIAKAAGLNVAQGLSEQFGDGMANTAPGFGGGYWGKKGTGDGITGGLVDPAATYSPSIVPGYESPITGESDALGGGLALTGANGLLPAITGVEGTQGITPLIEASITEVLADTAPSVVPLDNTTGAVVTDPITSDTVAGDTTTGDTTDYSFMDNYGSDYDRLGYGDSVTSSESGDSGESGGTGNTWSSWTSSSNDSSSDSSGSGDSSSNSSGD